MAIKNYFSDVPNQNPNDAMSLLPSPYYSYSGQENLFTPRGYAQNTLVDLLSTRGALGEAVADEEVTTEATEATEPAFQEVRDSGEQSFFNGMDVNEGDSLDFDSLSDLSLTDGLLGGKRVSDNAPKNWNTQHQREFDALVASGYRPKAKWTGSDWYVYAPELAGTAFGEPGTIPFGENKYKGQGIPNLFAGMTGSFNPDEVFKKNLADALKSKDLTRDDATKFDVGTIPAVDPTELAQEGTPMQDSGSVTAKRGGTVTAKEGGTVKAKTPTVEAKPKSVSLMQVIKNADKKHRQAEKDARDKVRDAKEKMGRGRGGYGF